MSPEGVPGGAAAGLAGRRFPTAFVGIGTLNNLANALDLPLAEFGQYRAQSMRDASDAAEEWPWPGTMKSRYQLCRLS